MKRILSFLLVISFHLSAQIKTVLKDSLTRKPIPYISAWSLDSDYAITSNKKGKIKIKKEYENNNFLFFSSDYEVKKVTIKSLGKELLLMPKKQVDNSDTSMKISSKKLIKQDMISFYGIKSYYSIEKKSTQLLAQFIPFQSFCNNLMYLDEIIVGAKAHGHSGILKIRFFESDSLGRPASEIFLKQIVLKVPVLGFVSNEINENTGVTADLKPYKIRFPKSGLFVAFEFMYTNENISSIKTVGNEFIEMTNPFILTNESEGDPVWEFKQGKWSKMENATPILMKLSLTN